MRRKALVPALFASVRLFFLCPGVQRGSRRSKEYDKPSDTRQSWPRGSLARALGDTAVAPGTGTSAHGKRWPRTCSEAQGDTIVAMQETLPFYRLIYTSRVNLPLDTDRLLAQAQKNNPARGITGGLAVLNGVCLQYLEGEEDAVESLFARILPDERHADVKVLERRGVPRRMFSDWSMAMLHWTESAKQIFRSFSPDNSGLDLYETDPTTAAPLFRAWAATEDWLRLS